MARVKTFANGGRIFPADLNAIQDDYEFAFSGWQDVTQRGGVSPTGAGAALYLFTGSDETSPVMGGVAAFIPFDPADYAAGSRGVKARLRVWLRVNGTAPGSNWTVGLYSAGSILVAGSTVAFNAPVANLLQPGVGGEVTAPPEGVCMIGVVNSAGAAAGSILTFTARLQVRRV